MSSSHCGLVADAGSSGTRVYLVRVDDKNEAIMEVVGQQRGGLAVVGAKKAFEAGLGDALKQGHSQYEEKCGKEEDPPLVIFGTGGTRLISPEKNQLLWTELTAYVNTFMKEKQLKFNILTKFQTITGEEEGFFSVLALNLAKKKLDPIKLSALSDDLEGTLDMGGASTQVGFVHAKKEINGAPLILQDCFVKSYLGYGANEFWKYGTANAPLENACQGNTPMECQKLSKVLMDAKAYKTLRGGNADFSEATTTMLRSGFDKVTDFHAASGFYWNGVYAQWLLGPEGISSLDKAFSISELDTIAKLVCAVPYEQKKIKYDNAGDALQKLIPWDLTLNKCYEWNYMVVLLRDVYDWPVNEKKIYLAKDVDGSVVEWPLGALLYSLRDSKTTEEKGCCTALAIGGAIFCFLFFTFLSCFYVIRKRNKEVGDEYDDDVTEKILGGNSGETQNIIGGDIGDEEILNYSSNCTVLPK